MSLYRHIHTLPFYNLNYTFYLLSWSWMTLTNLEQISEIIKNMVKIVISCDSFTDNPTFLLPCSRVFSRPCLGQKRRYWQSRRLRGSFNPIWRKDVHESARSPSTVSRHHNSRSSSSFLTTTIFGRRRPLPHEICAQIVRNDLHNLCVWTREAPEMAIVWRLVLSISLLCF